MEKSICAGPEVKESSVSLRAQSKPAWLDEESEGRAGGLVEGDTTGRNGGPAAGQSFMISG